MLLLSMLLVQPAAADDAVVVLCATTDETAEPCDIDDDERDEDRDEGDKLEVELSTLAMWGDHGVAQTGRVRLASRRDTWLLVDGRFHADGRALGRLGAGVDLLGGGRAHLDLGAFFGTVGDWHTGEVLAAPQAGGMVRIGHTGERLDIGYAWRAGYGGGPLDGLLTEHELRVGYRVTQGVQVVGSFVRLTPGKQDKEHAGALGVAVTF